jgi:hypothetical protein
MKARSPARWLAGFSVVALVVSGPVSAAELHVMISAGFIAFMPSWLRRSNARPATA